jgi:hypothetical protein
MSAQLMSLFYFKPCSSAACNWVNRWVILLIPLYNLPYNKHLCQPSKPTE